MAYFRHVRNNVYQRLATALCSKESRDLFRLKLPAVGGILALLAGCGYSHQAAPARSAQAPVVAQATPPPAADPKNVLQVPNHPAVDSWVIRFSEKNHKSFQTQLDRARFYSVPAREIFGRKGLPPDLIMVALVESGFSPMARSHAKAVGMWQFIPSTGSRFGLEQNRYIDERRHPMKAAAAAADYLSFLYDTFGSWPLALAAYNAGENGVQNALLKSGMKTFWELREYGYLPAETCDYVPKVLASVKISRSPAKYGFHYDPNYYVERHETVKIPGGVKLSWVGKQTGISEGALLDCNPELCQPVTPPACSDYELCVPIGTKEDVLAALAKKPQQEEKSDWQPGPDLKPGPYLKATAAAAKPAPAQAAPAPVRTAITTYKVKPGDTWYSLATRYKTSVGALIALNGKSSSSALKTGQTVKVPGGTVKVPSATVQVAKAQVAAPAKRGKESIASTGNGKKSLSDIGPKSIHYMVRQGDTLGSIAEKFHIPLKTLCTLNKMNPNQKLVPGNVLAVTVAQQDVRTAKRK